MDRLIHSYFKKGEEQGFSKEYVKDTLLKKGYDRVRVQMIYNGLTSTPSQHDSSFYNLASSANDETYHSIREPKRPVTLFIGIAIGVLFLIGTLAFFLHAGEGIPTGAIILDGPKTKQAQTTLEDMSVRDSEISKKSQLIGDALDQINGLELSNDEKAQIIRRQLYEIQELHKDIESQQKDIHDLLWDLMKDILKKGQPVPDSHYE